MNEHIFIPRSQQDRPMMQRPIWAPNPGVPLTARILSYIFALLVVVTIFRSCAYERPSDLPVFPRQWASYLTPQGMKIPYPSDWSPADHTQNGEPDFYFALGNSVHIEVSMAEASYDLDTSQFPEIEQHIEENMQKDLPGYSPQVVDAVTGWHLFHLTPPHSHKPPLQGAWTARIQGNRVACLIAVAPNEGWPAMAQVFTYVLDNFNMQ